MFEDTRPAPLPAAGGREAWDDFRVNHPKELVGLLRQIRDGQAPVQLSGPGGQAFTSTLWSMDDQRQRLNFTLDGVRVDTAAMIDADELVAVAYLESVKLQFDLSNLLIVRGNDTSALQTSWPREMYRFQRRSAYRVRTLERSSPTAHMRHPALPDMLLSMRVVDVSIGGCALFVGPDVPTLQAGVTISVVRIELDADTRFDVGLRMQHATVINSGNRGVRIGCEWTTLSPIAERVLQRYIDQTQKRRRMLTLE